jgi:hypothetical protein
VAATSFAEITAGASRDAVDIARQIGQHGLWAAERALGIYDPFGSEQRSQIRRERLRVGEGGVIAEELQAVGLGERPLREEPSEQARERAQRQKKAGVNAFWLSRWMAIGSPPMRSFIGPTSREERFC